LNRSATHPGAGYLGSAAGGRQLEIAWSSRECRLISDDAGLNPALPMLHDIAERMQMADLVQITFPTEEKAEQVRQKLLDLQKEYLIELSDAVIAVKQPDGHVKLNQLFHPTAASAVSGTFWGALIGIIFLMPRAGAAIGAASGALGGALAG